MPYSGERSLQRRFWETEVKEGSFTVPLSKTTALASEARHGGEVDVESTASSLVAGMQNTKAFLKAHRDYKKSEAKVPRIVGMRPLLQELFQWLAKLNISPVHSITLLYAQACFYSELERAEGQPKLADAIETALGVNMLSAMTGMQNDSFTRQCGRIWSASLWLR